MATPMFDKYYGAQILDVSTASTAHVAAGGEGLLHRVFITLSAGITSANAVITVAVRGTTVGTITVVQSGSDAGSVFEAVMTGSEAARFMRPGDVMSFATNGGSSTASIGRITAVVREH